MKKGSFKGKNTNNRIIRVFGLVFAFVASYVFATLLSVGFVDVRLMFLEKEMYYSKISKIVPLDIIFPTVL